jgi:hypothetical protein
MPTVAAKLLLVVLITFFIAFGYSAGLWMGYSHLETAGAVFGFAFLGMLAGISAPLPEKRTDHLPAIVNAPDRDEDESFSDDEI